MAELDHYYAVILAGGGGTRLWPLSRQDQPKQSLPLLGEQTMFQIAVRRLAPLFPPERILVVTSARYAADLQRQAPEVPPANFISEPAPRGTAPAIALSAQVLQQRDPQAVMACLTADHYIGQEGRFRALLAAAAAVAQADYLVTLGVTPTFPATGFGYIQRGAPLGDFGGFTVYRAERFKEKPAPSEAQALLADGLHSWNSGMFVWRTARILAEVERQLPTLHRVLQRFAAQPENLPALWDGAPNETIDYGIMERAAGIAVIPADGLEWNDIGSWEALLDVLPPDADGNVVIGAEHVHAHSSHVLVHSSTTRPGRLIATLGLRNMIIVDTDDVLLVCPRDRAQEVRLLVDQLKQRAGGKVYL
ncbi:MAG: mannose-1-phosphate guanylyltransferase [Anaerolineales bacterium]|nr:mannose-1-phosphate guanylyltransferase [Anaerolineales bacterium]